MYVKSSCNSVVTINIGSPRRQGLLENLPIQRISLPFGLGTGTERPQTCGVLPFKVSPTQRALNSSLDASALTLLVCS